MIQVSQGTSTVVEKGSPNKACTFLLSRLRHIMAISGEHLTVVRPCDGREVVGILQISQQRPKHAIKRTLCRDLAHVRFSNKKLVDER